MARARRTFEECCPPVKAVPRKSWVTQEVWAFLRAHAAARRNFSMARKKCEDDCAARSKLRLAFLVLRGQAQVAALALKAHRHQYAVATKALKIVAAGCAKEVRRAKARWLEDEAKKVGAAAAGGSTKELWQQVRKCSGKVKKGPRAAMVLKLDGEVVSDPAVKEEMLEDHFFAEFGHRGEYLQQVEWDHQVKSYEETLPPAPVADMPPLDETRDAVYNAMCKARNDKANGEDDVCVELARACGAAFKECMVQLTQTSLSTCIPKAWRSGIMCLVPKTASTPASLSNGRGVLLSSQMGKLVAKIGRNHLCPALAAETCGTQAGAVRNGGCEFPHMIVHYFNEWATKQHRSSAVLFTDLKAAYYRCINEYALGYVLDDTSRAKLFCKAGLPTDARAKILEIVAEEATAIKAQGVAAIWRRFARDWHSWACFRTREGQRIARPWSGTRPGDPLADVCFAMVFAAVQLEIREFLDAKGWQHTFRGDGASIFGDVDTSVHTRLHEPCYMDDLAICLSSASPDGLCEALVTTMDGVGDICKKYGFELNLAEKKTKAVVVFRGKDSIATRRRLFFGDDIQNNHNHRDDLADDPQDLHNEQLDRPCAPVIDGPEGSSSCADPRRPGTCPGASLQPPAIPTIPTLATKLGPLRIVQEYKHLGSQFTGRKSQRKECQFRRNAARAATMSLAKRVLSNQ